MSRNNNNNRRNGGNKPNKGGNGKLYSTNVSNYYVNEQMEKDAANYNWSLPLGRQFPFPGMGTALRFGEQSSIPTLTTFKVQPTLGVSISTSSPANMMARLMYNYCIRINSANTAYDPVDMQIGVVAMNSIVAFMAWAKRLYSIAFSYSVYNRSFPYVLAKANHVDLDNLVSNLQDYRTWYNQLCQKIKPIFIPSNIPYFERNAELFDGIYFDENDNARAQTYMFVPDVFYVFNETHAGGGRLEPMPIDHILVGDLDTAQFSADGDQIWEEIEHDLTYSEIKAMGDRLVEPLLGSQDMTQMFADIEKAYGSNNMLTFDYITDEVMEVPAYYSEDILSQIENMRIVPHAKQVKVGTTLATTSELGYYYPIIYQNPSINAGNLMFQYWGSDPLFTPSSEMRSQRPTLQTFYEEGKNMVSHKDTINPSDIMVATRLCPTIDDNTDATQGAVKYHSAYVGSCGTEIVVGQTVWAMRYRNGIMDVYSEDIPQFSFIAVGESSGFTAATQALRATTLINSFNRHPEWIRWANSDAAQQVHADPIAYLFDIDKYTTIPKYDLEKMHITALLGQFKAPEYKYSR